MGRRAAMGLFGVLLALASAVGAEEEQGGSAPRDILWTEAKLYSSSNEEVIIRDFFQDRRGGFFVDVGCSHPRRNSNTYYLERYLGWTGIGVDALPEYAKEWAKFRPESRFENFLVTDHSDTQETFYKLPVWGASTAEKELAERRPGAVPIQVRSITLDDLLERSGVEHLDLLSIDVEGHHEAVLAGFDLPRWHPELVCIEEEGAYVVPWFRARGYEPIGRYRARDGANWYFAPKAEAEAADARRTVRDDQEAARRAELLAREPPASPLRVYLNPKYVLDGHGALVLNDQWVATTRAMAAAGSSVPGKPRAASGVRNDEEEIMGVPITGFYAGLLGLVLLWLSMRIVVTIRGKAAISYGDGGNPQFTTVMRGQGNFVEYVPMALILMAVDEMAGTSATVLHAMGVALVVARILHPLGLTTLPGPNPLRFVGTLTTWIVLLVASILAIGSYL